MRKIAWMALPLLAACLWLASGSAAGAITDVLDTPAAPSTLAARKLVNALALAGTRLVGAGQRGHIVYSDDQGKQWVQAKVPVSADLVALHFPTPTVGWAVGHDGVVLRSIDAGANWTRRLDGRGIAKLLRAKPGEAPADLDHSLLDVWFDDADHGFVVGAFNLILYTSDGGASWQPWMDRTDNPRRFHLNAIRAIGGALYIAGEQGLLLRRELNGARFTQVATPYRGSYFGVAGHDDVIIVYGLRGHAFRSGDAGRSWKKIETGLALGLTASATLPDRRLVLVSQAGHVLVSKDGGQAFTVQQRLKPGPAAAAAAVAGNAVALAGTRGIRIETLEP